MQRGLLSSNLQTLTHKKVPSKLRNWQRHIQVIRKRLDYHQTATVIGDLDLWVSKSTGNVKKPVSRREKTRRHQKEV